MKLFSCPFLSRYPLPWTRCSLRPAEWREMVGRSGVGRGGETPQLRPKRAELLTRQGQGHFLQQRGRQEDLGGGWRGWGRGTGEGWGWGCCLPLGCGDPTDTFGAAEDRKRGSASLGGTFPNSASPHRPRPFSREPQACEEGPPHPSRHSDNWQEAPSNPHLDSWDSPCRGQGRGR